MLILLSLWLVHLRLSEVWFGLDEGQQGYPGSPAHLRRIEQIKATVGAESLEELIANLHDEEAYHYPGVESPIDTPQDDFERFLSSRRTARLQEVLAGLPEGEQAQTVQRLVRETFEVQQWSVESTIRSHVEPKTKDAPQAKPGKKGKDISALGTKMAMGAALWLAAQFQGVESVLERVQRIEAYAAEVDDRLAKDNRCSVSLRWAIRMLAFPDNACKLNLLVQAVRCDPRTTPAQLESLATRLRQLPTKRLVLVPWNARITAFDKPHVMEGVPVDRSKGAVEVDVYEWGERLRDESFQRRVLGDVKRLAAAVAGKSS